MANYVVAVSGGLDSMVLLDMLQRQVEPTQLTVAHFNHRTRGKESDQDAKFVSGYCKKHSLKLVTGQREGQGLSEDSLRRERHAFLEKVRLDVGADGIIFAHHLEDQIETFFLRLLRGTSVRGLACMRVKSGKRLRPLLGISKSDLRAYARVHRIRYREDSSNSGTQYLRNRVRLDLLPAFYQAASLYGDERRVKTRLCNLIEDIQKIECHLAGEVRRAKELTVVRSPYWFRVECELFKNLPSVIRLRLCHSLLSRLGMESVGRSEVNRVAKAIYSKNGKFDLVGGISVEISCGVAYLRNAQHRARLKIVLLRSPKLEGDLESRFFQAGDRLGNTKLKKLFLEKRIPAPERALVRVVAKKRSHEVTRVIHPLF